jgi:hypothetical protein
VSISIARFCYVPGCVEIVDGDKLFCLPHWQKIPTEQQAALFRAQAEEREQPRQTFNDDYPEEDWMGVEEREEVRRHQEIEDEFSFLRNPFNFTKSNGKPLALFGSNDNPLHTGLHGWLGFVSTGQPIGRPPVRRERIIHFTGTDAVGRPHDQYQYALIKTKTSMCTKCISRPRIDGKTRCAVCLERNTGYVGRLQHKRRLAGLCGQCGVRPAMAWRCESCAAKRRKSRTRAAA